MAHVNMHRGTCRTIWDRVVFLAVDDLAIADQAYVSLFPVFRVSIIIEGF